jgi:4-hydroxy-3-polyprenylbenzoate decarboxylase
MKARTIVVGVTGASGSVYARRLCQELALRPVKVRLVMSEAGALVMKEELGVSVDLEDGAAVIRGLLGRAAKNFRYDHYKNIGAGISSGSYPFDAMVVVPCTTGTLGGIASGISRNLIERAAEVTLKERRNLILVVRETPLSLGALENMAAVVRAGGCVLPAMPGFYHLPQTVDDVVNFLVGKILSQLGMDHALIRRRVEKGSPPDE